jgi:PKD repeat protein
MRSLRYLAGIIIATLVVWGLFLSGSHGVLPGPSVARADTGEYVITDEDLLGPCGLTEQEAGYVGDVIQLSFARAADLAGWIDVLQGLDAYGSVEMNEAVEELNNILKWQRELEADIKACAGIGFGLASDSGASGSPVAPGGAVVAMAQGRRAALPRRVKQDMARTRALLKRGQQDQKTLDAARKAVKTDTQKHDHVARHQDLETALSAAEDGITTVENLKASVARLVRDYHRAGLKPVVYTRTQAKALISYVSQHGNLPRSFRRQLAKAGFNSDRINAVTDLVGNSSPGDLVIHYPDDYVSPAYKKTFNTLHRSFAALAQTMRQALVDIAPACSIDYTPTNPTTALGRNTVHFNANANDDIDGGLVSYRWNFGDGSPVSTAASPQHTFAPRGTADSPVPYHVTLTVTENDGSKTCTDSNDVPVVHNYPPEVYYGYVAGSAAYQVVFNGSVDDNLDGGSVDKITWDFGDGTVVGPEDPTDANLNPVHTYTHSGLYYVTLTATDTDGNQTDKSTAYTDTFGVQVGPAASFYVGDPGAAPDQANNLAGTPTQFNDSSGLDFNGDPVVKWSWDFGDGTNPDADANPTHQYAAPGTYHVTLTVTDSLGQTDETPVQDVDVPLASQ